MQKINKPLPPPTELRETSSGVVVSCVLLIIGMVLSALFVFLMAVLFNYLEWGTL